MTDEPNDPKADEADHETWSGRLVDGRYRVDRFLAKGGMGLVLSATHVSLQRRVALKVLARQFRSRKTVVERFLREARTASSLQHPNIVDVLDLGRFEDGTPFLAMEFLEGRDLDAVLAEEPSVSLERVVAWLSPIASALDAVHARGLVHRDIKPGNLFLCTPDETPKLLDFGLAILRDDEGERLTRDGTVLGTPHYLSPESALGGEPDPSGDIYSLACVAFELLTGRLPHDAASAMGVMTAKVLHPAATLKEASGLEFGQGLEQAFAAALAIEPGERPPTASAFVDGLRACLGGSAPHGPVGPPSADTSMETMDELPVIEAVAQPTAPASAQPLDEPAPEWSAAILSSPPRAARALPLARWPLALAALLVVGGVGGAMAWSSSEEPRPRELRAEAHPEAPAAFGAASPEPAPAPLIAPALIQAAPAPMEEPVAPAPSPARVATAPRPTPSRAAAPVTATPNTNEAGSVTEAAPTVPNEAVAAAPVGVGELVREARTALLTGRFVEAEQTLRTATRRAPQSAEAWRSLGLVQERLGQSAEARASYGRYLELAPTAGDAAQVRQRHARL